MDQAIVILGNHDAAPDTTANKAIREVASTPSPQHIIPAEIIAFLYEHVDLMRAELFGGRVPEVVLSFDVTDRRMLGHYHLSRNGLGVRWALNLNPVHLARPVYQVLATLLHELAHNADPGIMPSTPASHTELDAGRAGDVRAEHHPLCRRAHNQIPNRLLWPRLREHTRRLGSRAHAQPDRHRGARRCRTGGRRDDLARRRARGRRERAPADARDCGRRARGHPGKGAVELLVEDAFAHPGPEE